MSHTVSESETATVDTAIRELIETYHELNADVIDELHEEPSALEFMRYVARNRPFVVRNGAESWKAVQKWDSNYLIDVVGDCQVHVAITPHGNADAVLAHADGTLSFVKPLERQERFSDVLEYIHAQETSFSNPPSNPIKYAQTQNDNLRTEYNALFSDVPPSIPFARIALDQPHPDAINLWLGNSYSTTSLHKDNYENIYVQIRGSKSFVLLPPIAAPAVDERSLEAMTYVYVPDDNNNKNDNNDHNNHRQNEAAGGIRKQELVPLPDDPPSSIPVATYDPDTPELHKTPYTHLLRPMRVELNEGDMLYLPALWYHKVAQKCGEEGFCCAVNYWYDLDFGGGFWAGMGFVRAVGIAVGNAGGDGGDGGVVRDRKEE